ncbi:DUF4446 family protein [Thermovenabulum sp.]|uniref:DUF4446 family protein n=1 Tax=Thermovenabulum sp. TaxID=3100335 RepID=UPI003C79D771
MQLQYIQEVKRLIGENIDTLILITVFLYIAALIIFIAVSVKLTKIMKKYQALTRGMDGKNLEEILMMIAKDVKEAKEEGVKIQKKVKDFEERSKAALQKFHAIRYNAFENMGSDLSFSIALLNGNNDGFIITSIYGRDENRVYLKPISGGTSTYLLSEEEKKVLQKALSE